MLLIKLEEADIPQKGQSLLCNRARDPLPLPLPGLPPTYKVVYVHLLLLIPLLLSSSLIL